MVENSTTQAQNSTQQTTQPIHERLAGHHLLITGSTGFLAKVFIEKLLRSVDTLGSLCLLVRPKSDGTSSEKRVTQEVFGSSVFDRLRASMGDGFARLCEDKIHVVSGDLTQDYLGMGRQRYDELTKTITLVINSAATVTFDERIDLALQLNTRGPSRLLQFAKDGGDLPFMHVSTCYVSGVRKGVVVEDFSAPERARELLPRLNDGGGFDLEELIESLQAEAIEIRHRFASDPDACRKHLIDIGMDRAREYGWNDTYTFTKWIGEQLLVRDRGSVPLVVFRPAIIEGSFDEPAPGWIDGLRMADPVIVAYGRGKINEFPVDPKLSIDLIPADFVSNAMIATLPVGSERSDSLKVYQCGSSDRNPLKLRVMRGALERAYRIRPMNDDRGHPIRPGPLRLVHRDVFLKRWQRKQNRINWFRDVIKKMSLPGRWVRKLSGISRQIEQLIYFAKIYSPYTHLDCSFADDELQLAAGRLNENDHDMYPFDVELIDWDDYIVHRHVPGLRGFVLGKGSEPSSRLRAVDDSYRTDHGVAAESLQGTNIFDVFRRAAERFKDKPAFQIRRNHRWVRYTYHEALCATGTLMQRFTERGLKPGDRVAICDQSSPEWGLTYLSIMRSGMTAIPLDPQLAPREAWSAAKFAGAKLMCAGPSTFDGLDKHRESSDPELVLIRTPFIPKPGASRDQLPDPIDVDDTSLASILFTSGTTVSPKAVQLSHRNLIANARALVDVHRILPTDELLSVLPMYHAFEFTGGFVIPLASGATLTYIDQFKGSEVMSAMQATGTTVMLVVPRLLRMFYDSIEQQIAQSNIVVRGIVRICKLLSSMSGGLFGKILFRPVHKKFGGRLRMFVSGGSGLDPELYDGFKRMGFKVYEGYGLTETSPVLTVNPPDASLRGSVGPPLPNLELQLRNENLESIGEVWVKGPSVMSGYLNNPEATAEVLVDGWFRTGDLGRLDSRGYLFLTGRSKDLIVTSAGKNVYPDEIEFHYKDLPFASELCVFGMTSTDGLGEVVHGVVVLDRESAPEFDRSSMEREIRSAAALIGESLPTHQRISNLHFWDRELPKTSTLKAKRNLIREMVSTEDEMVGSEKIGSSSQTPSPEAQDDVINDDAFRAVQQILSSQTKISEDDIKPHMHFQLDLGIDSIGKIDALGTVEARFSMHIGDEDAANISRVRDLLRLIGERKPGKDVPRRVDTWQKRLGGETETVKTNGHLSTPLIPLRWIVRGSVNVLMNTYVRVSARGKQNIPATGAFILAPNHSSHLDTPSVITAIGGQRRVWTAGAEDYFFNTRIKKLIFGKFLDTIAFDRRADGIAGLRRCGQALSKGDGLLIFPEGTRSITGELQPFKIGVAVLAMERQVPIVPVHIHRSFDLLPKGGRMIKPGAITVTFGLPIEPVSADEVTDHYDAFQAMTRQVEEAVTKLAAEANA